MSAVAKMYRRSFKIDKQFGHVFGTVSVGFSLAMRFLLQNEITSYIIMSASKVNSENGCHAEVVMAKSYHQPSCKLQRYVH